MSIAKQISYYRRLCELTRTDFANLIDVSVVTVINYENGTAVPTTEKCVEIAHVLGITTDQLIGIN